MKKIICTLLMLLGALASARGETALHRGNGGEAESLDPAFAGSAAEIDILGDMMVGLTTLDAGARPIPGIAQSWDISPSGLTWTFHLRDARWSDGRPVTAPDFVRAWRRLLDPATAARQAAALWVLKNGRAISSGKLPAAALGVTAIGPRTLQLDLEYPAPYLPDLLTLPAALPLPEGPVGKSFRVCDGPYLLKDWTPNDHITLVKNPRFYDAASVRIATVYYYPTQDSQAALRRFRAGELDMQTPLPSAGLAWMRANMSGALHVMPSLALAYIVFNLKDPALADLRVRRALNLVYDREAVAHKVMTLGEAPAYSYVPPGIANYGGGPVQDFKPMAMAARLTLARKLMQDVGYGPFNHLHLRYATSGNPDSKRLAAVFQAMARQAYVDIQISVADYPLTLRALRQGQFQLGYTSWLADYDDAANFLDRLRSGDGGNFAGYRSKAFDAAMDAAQAQPDSRRRAALLRAAEAIALKDYPWLPIRFVSQTEAVSPHVGGYVPNRRDFNRSRWLWLR